MSKMLNICTKGKQITGSDFAKMILNQNRFERENIAKEVLLSGNVPSWQKTFFEVKITEIIEKRENVLILNVLPDYLSIGTDDDFVRIPLFPGTSQNIANEWNCLLPTTKIVYSVWHHAPGKLPPQPWGPPYDASMMSNDRIYTHNSWIDNSINKSNIDKTKLIAGHKKDIVITNDLIKRPKQVAIFGWHKLDGKPIQPLYLGHESTYADYSHGTRLIDRECVLNNSCADLESILMSESLNSLVSFEGQMKITKYS